MLFAREGASVLAVDQDMASAQQTADLILAAGDVAAAFRADVAVEADVALISDACDDHFGPPTILHNNVGIGTGDGGVTGMKREVWDRIFEVNVTGMYLTCKHVIPAMRAAGGGSIVNQSSTAAWMGISGFYGLAKASINFLTTSLAHELAHHDIRINAIAPGPTDTGALAKQVPAEFQEPLVASLAIKRLGTPADHVGPALFLLSDEASWITGHVLAVDGGQVTRI